MLSKIALTLALVVLLMGVVSSTVSATPPTVETRPIVYTSWEEATGQFEVMATGGWMVKAWGFEYGTESGVYTHDVTETGEIAHGVYSVTIAGLKPNTTYYYRVQASNKDGWYYGEELTFTTTAKDQWRKEWQVEEDVWVGKDNGSWYWLPYNSCIYVGYSCIIDIACGAGLRFTGVGIPQGYEIDEAYLYIQACSSQLGSPKSRIVATSDSAAFSTVEDYFARVRTSSFVYWDDPEVFISGEWYRSPDISSVVQEVTGNDSIVVFWEDHDDRSGHEEANQRVLEADATKLVVTWSVPESVSSKDNGSTSPLYYALLGGVGAGLILFVVKKRKNGRNRQYESETEE